MDAFPGFKLSDSVEDFRKKWHTFIMKKHFSGENIFGIHLSDATAFKDLDDKRKAMEKQLNSFQKRKEESSIRIRIPCVNTMMQVEAGEPKCVANLKEKETILSVSKKQCELSPEEKYSILNVSKKQYELSPEEKYSILNVSKKQCELSPEEKYSILNVSKKQCELSPKETTSNVYAELTRNQFDEAVNESDQNYDGLEILDFIQGGTSEEELCDCIKELPAGVVKDFLRKLRQNKTKEMKRIVALVQGEIRKKKGKSTSSKFKKRGRKQDSQKELMSFESESGVDVIERRTEYDSEVPLKCTETNCVALKEDASSSADDNELKCTETNCVALDEDASSSADDNELKCTETNCVALEEDASSSADDNELKCTETNCVALNYDASSSADDNDRIHEDHFEFSGYADPLLCKPQMFYDSDESDRSSTTWESEKIDCSYVWPIIFEDNLHLLNIYEEIMNELTTEFDLEDFEVEGAIELMNFNYRHVYKGVTPFVIDFNDKSNCVGYLHRFAPCHAALVENEVASVLNSCPEISSKLESKHELNIVCLGGGPGNDLIGLLSAFTGMSWDDCDLWDFTVVDKMAGWAEVLPLTVKRFVRDRFDSKFLMENEMPEISESFIAADLTNIRTWNRDMKEKLKKADVMTAVKVLSNIPETHRLLVLENVVRHMKPGAILFFIDCPTPPQELFFRNPSLKIRHKTEIEEFDFPYKKLKFGCSNITTCRAATYVIELPSANKTDHVPDLDDVTEWPTLA